MFAYRDHLDGVEVAFTDGSIDLQGLQPGFDDALAQVEQATGVHLARLNQVHGDHVVAVDADPGPGARPTEAVPVGDGLVTGMGAVGLMVRTADCVPVVLADPDVGVLAVAHAGRPGLAVGVVPRTLAAMAERGARRVTAWLGPHVCGRCYEVPASMRDDVAAGVPASHAETSWGTPSLDLAAGVQAQLAASGTPEAPDGPEVTVRWVGPCTLEHSTLHSYRRDGAASGRLAGLVWRP